MRKSEDIYFKDDNGQRHFMATALSARDGFKLIQEGTLLLVKAGALGAMGITGDINKAAANFSLEALQKANINSDDLLDFENSLLKSVTYISPEGMGITGDINKAAANFSLEALQKANINSDDLLDFENSLLKSVTYISPEGTLIPISWDNIDSYCQDQMEVMKLLTAAFKVNFGFLKNALQSISQPLQREQKEKPTEQARNTSKRPIFQMR